MRACGLRGGRVVKVLERWISKRQGVSSQTHHSSQGNSPPKSHRATQTNFFRQCLQLYWPYHGVY